MDSAVRHFAPYRFALAFESHDLPGYVTEKIVNAYLAGAVPVYWGTARVKEVFDSRSFLFAGDFPSLEALADEVPYVKTHVYLALSLSLYI